MLNQTVKMIGITGEVAAQTHHLGTGKQRQQYDGQRAPVFEQAIHRYRNNQRQAQGSKHHVALDEQR